MTEGTYYDVLDRRRREHREMREAVKRGERVRAFIPTGFKEWDRNGGTRLGSLTVIAGDTGEGKSQVKRRLMRAAAEAGYRALVLDFEDDEGDTADREFADATGVAAHDIGALKYDDDELERMDTAVEEAASWALLIDYRPELMRAEDITEALGDHDIVFIDYLQAIPAAAGKTLERTLADLAWDLNVWAKGDPERGIPKRAVVAFSQIKSDVEERGQAWYARNSSLGYPQAFRGFIPGPGKGDLSWCGAIGERARDLTYLHRPGRRPRLMGIPGVKDDRLLIIKAKVNFGREGRMELGWDGERARIHDL